MRVCFVLFLPFFSFYSWAGLKKEINPTGTYLYVDYFEDSLAEEATALLLKDIPVKKKETIELSFHSITKQLDQILAVFSNLSGAFIPFEEEFISPISSNTQHSNITTDIPYDFGVSSDKCAAVRIPEEADRLLFSPSSLFLFFARSFFLTIKEFKSASK
ncbi:MAG: hypothetical protein OXN83_01640 [Oligoflexia bacterium]|nr:hypothetical protein [Oligoflexia bacterium]